MMWFCEVTDGPWQGTYLCKEQEIRPGIVQNEAQLLCFATEGCEIDGRFRLISPTALKGVPTTPAEMEEYLQFHVYQLEDRIEDESGVQTLVKYIGVEPSTSDSGRLAKAALN